MREPAADTHKGRDYRHIKLQFQAGREKDRREILHDIANSNTAVSGAYERELKVYAANVSVKDAMSKDTFESESGVTPDIEAIRIGDRAQLKLNMPTKSVVWTESTADDYSKFVVLRKGVSPERERKEQNNYDPLNHAFSR